MRDFFDRAWKTILAVACFTAAACICWGIFEEHDERTSRLKDREELKQLRAWKQQADEKAALEAKTKAQAERAELEELRKFKKASESKAKN